MTASQNGRQPSDDDQAHEDSEDLEEWSDDYNGLLSVKYAGQSRAFEVGSRWAGQRLDVAVAGLLPEVSRSRIQKWISEGHVTVDRQKTRPSLCLQSHQTIEVAAPAPESVTAWEAEDIALDIVYEDSDVIVLNKPHALVVHPAPGHRGGTLVNGLLFHCPALALVARAGIVHRLDQDTTGLLVVAKTISAQFSLVQQLQRRTITRLYLALVWGVLESDCTIDAPLARDRANRQRWAVASPGKGKPAITHVTPLAHGEYRGFAVTLVQCRLETGRTHQIRVHLQSIRHPLVGDAVYHRHCPHASRLRPLGAREQAFTRQALHAWRLAFDHPATGKAMNFRCDLPADFRGLIKTAGIGWKFKS